MNNEEVVNDFRRRYEGTFVKVLAADKGINIVGNIRRVRSDPERFATIEILTKEYGTVHTNMGSEEYQLRFDFPKVGVFHADSVHGPLIFYRRAEKQYTRGVGGGNSVLMSPVRAYASIAPGLGLVNVAESFNHKVYEFREAVRMLKAQGVWGVALQDDFSIVQPMSTAKPYYVIFHWQQIIATVDDKGNIMRLHEQAFEKILNEVIHV